MKILMIDLSVLTTHLNSKQMNFKCTDSNAQWQVQSRVSVDCSSSVVAEIPSSCARIIKAKAECSDKMDAQF